MAMSRDRILFWPHGPTGCNPRRSKRPQEHFRATEHALRVACGLTGSEASDVETHGRGILARPSQFARFVVLRERAGGQNLMAQMNMQALYGADYEVASQYSNIIDVARRNPAPNLIGAGFYTRPSGDVESFGYRRAALPINRILRPHEYLENEVFAALHGKEAVQLGVAIHAAASRADGLRRNAACVIGTDLAEGSDETAIYIGAPSSWRVGSHTFTFKRPTMLKGEDARLWISRMPKQLS